MLCSCDILPERREYERTSTTAMSAYLAPTVRRYLERMVRDITNLGLKRQVYIMQSNGGLNTPQTATAHPGSLLLSGPAAGVVAAAALGAQALAHARSIRSAGRIGEKARIKPGYVIPQAAASRLDLTAAARIAPRLFPAGAPSSRSQPSRKK